MTYRRLTWCVVLAGAVSGCSPDVERVRLVLSDPAGTCDPDILNQIDALVPEFRSPADTQRPCQAAGTPEIQSIAELQAILSGSTRFADLDQGHYLFKISGFDDHCPDPRDLLLCGVAEFDLPAGRQNVSMVVTCHEGSSPPAAFSACEAR